MNLERVDISGRERTKRTFMKQLQLESIEFLFKIFEQFEINLQRANLQVVVYNRTLAELNFNWREKDAVIKYSEAGY